ncbi:MAG: TrkH family potassium uptake protein [Armatimonadetes bacterium]|nr:TrkH family potassium uptake protein [Armatimonadota bacterium]
MNRNLVLRTLGLVLLCESLAMLPSLLIAIYLKENTVPAFLIAFFVGAAVGLVLVRFPVDPNQLSYKEGFVIATFGWLTLAIFGSLPFVLSGALSHPADAFFETMSGFTTTGASVLADVEILPRSILLWRSFTHWLGGMGVIVLTVALIPSLRVAGLQLFRAEVPGPTKSKVLPRVAITSRELYRIYLMITIAEVVLLKIAGLSWFDSVVHTFGTVATGGFSNKNLSVGAYENAVIELIIVFFMIICGMNFALHYRAFRAGEGRAYWKDPEFKFYLGVIVFSTLLVALNLWRAEGYEIERALRFALFQVSSIVTTTGFATADFNQWPVFSQMILLLLMFIGGCAGSTGGAIKHIRVLILIKSASRQLTRLLHPQAVIPVRLGSHTVSEEVVGTVQAFFFYYLLIFLGVVIFLTALGLDLVSALSAVAATLGNVGPGLGLVGPASNYASLPVAAKVVLSMCMLIGRLEVYSVMVLLSTRFWKT